MHKQQATGSSAGELLNAFPALQRHNARVLILGSMPGVASLQEQRYYAHPRNAFWPIMQHCFGQQKPKHPITTSALTKPEHEGAGAQQNYAARVELLLDNKVAVWDVLKHCTRTGSLDSAIDRQSVVLNNFEEFFESHQQLGAIIFNGKTAEKLFRQQALPMLKQSTMSTPELHVMPSTSPAMASLSLAEKTAVWSKTLLLCLGKQPQTNAHRH